MYICIAGVLKIYGNLTVLITRNLRSLKLSYDQKCENIALILYLDFLYETSRIFALNGPKQKWLKE